MSDYVAQIAYLERIERTACPESAASTSVKAELYDLMCHDRPASAKFLVHMGGQQDGGVIRFPDFEVWEMVGYTLLVKRGQELFRNPTRGEVIALLWLYRRRRERESRNGKKAEG